MRNLGFRASEIWKLMEKAGMRGTGNKSGFMKGHFVPDKISTEVRRNS